MREKVNELFQKGELSEQDYEFIVKYYTRVINTVIFKMLGNANEDMLQELLVVLLKTIPKYNKNSDAKFTTWFKTILDRKALRYIYENVYGDGNMTEHYNKKLTNLQNKSRVGKLNKKDKKELEFLTSMSNQESYFEDSCINTYLDDVEYIMLSNDFYKFKETLGNINSRIVELLILGYTYEEIGIDLNISKQAVQQRVVILKSKVSKYLGVDNNA